MSITEKKTVLLNTIFNFGNTLVSTFIYVYLYIYTNSIPMMCLYIIIRIGCFPFFFILGSRLVKKHSFALTYIIGLVFIIVALIYALLGSPLFVQNPYYVLIAAAIIGSGEGFYYFSANTCNQIVSTDESRATFLVYNAVLSSISSVCSPFFASIVLSSVDEETKGYRILLYVIVVIFIFVVFVALSINAHSKDNDNSSVRKAMSFKDDEKWRDHNLAVFCYGLRDGLGLNTVNLLVYRAAGSGGTYSKLQTLFAIIGILAYYSTKRLLSSHITKTMNFGTVIKIVETLILLFIPNMFGAILYGAMNSFANAFYDNAYNYLSARIIGSYREEMTSRVVARETYLSIGRIVSMSFVLLCYWLLPENLYLEVSVSILAFTPLLTKKLLLKYR